jgi:predicted dehydrogenase
VKQRKRPTIGSQAFAEADHGADVKLVDVQVDDLASLLVRFDNGAKGSLSVGQVCAGHKNDLVVEVMGHTGSVRWQQERQNELWIGRRHGANEMLQKDPSLVVPDVRRYARLPGGHQEGWSDAFANVVRDIYEFIARGGRMGDPLPPTMATFADGCRAVGLVDAALRSARAGAWTRV